MKDKDEDLPVDAEAPMLRGDHLFIRTFYPERVRAAERKARARGERIGRAVFAAAEAGMYGFAFYGIYQAFFGN